MVAITITEMVYDKPMNLSTWVTSDGRAYGVQKDNTLVCLSPLLWGYRPKLTGELVG